MLAAIREQCKELHAIDDALGRLRGISYAVDIILCILAELAGLALRDVSGAVGYARRLYLFGIVCRQRDFDHLKDLEGRRSMARAFLDQPKNAPKQRPLLKVEAADGAYHGDDARLSLKLDW